MFDRKKILDKIKNPEDKLWFAKALEQAYSCIKYSEPAFTNFSDPYKAGELISLIGYSSELSAITYGGYTTAERVVTGFFPDYMEKDLSLFPISAIKISYNTKFSRELTHREFLGSILGLGITRDKIGDIILEDGYGIVLCQKDIASYIITNLERVSRTKVSCQELSIDSLKDRQENTTEKTIIVSSLRLDAVLSSAFNLSRGKISTFISSGHAFLNWKCEETPAKTIAEGDIITLRGMGRIKINEIKGKTKKDRLVLSILVYG